MRKRNQEVEPIRQSVHVDCPVDEAFRLFTERLSEWWPLAGYSLSKDEAESCELEPWTGGRLFERTRSGEEIEWGCVTGWEPPGRIAIAWQARGREEQTLEVRFDAEAERTRVTLIHSGWQFAGMAGHFAHFAQAQLAVFA